MSNIYKTPLFKSIKQDEKLGAGGKLIELEDLVPSLADKIKNAVGNSDLDFLKKYSDDGKSGGNLEQMFTYLNSKDVGLISHGLFVSDQKQFTIDGAHFYYYTSVHWNEIRINHTYEQRSNPFSGYESHQGSTGLTQYTGTGNKIHWVRLFNVAAPATISGGSLTVQATPTPIPDEVISACENGFYILNVSHTELVQNEPYTPPCKSVVFGEGMPIREQGIFNISAYNCLLTMNCSEYPTEVNAELIAFA